MNEETVMEPLSTDTADEAPSTVEPGPETSTLMEINFKKNPLQREKYLEGEPKALGVTQIMLGLFLISTQVFADFSGPFWVVRVIAIIFCVAVIIAGSLAIAAQNLHIPTMKTCLLLQTVACSGSVVFVCITSILLNSYHFLCNPYNQYDSKICQALHNTYHHLIAVEILTGAGLIALSATLAAFCCKVIKCCSPPPSVPMISVTASLSPPL